MTTQRTIAVQSYALQDLVERSHLSVSVAVPGYWSLDPIVVSARIEYDFSASRKATEAAGGDLSSLEDHAVHTLRVSITHSSGGRDTDEIPDDAAAVLQFAEGLRQAALVARTLQSQEAEIMRMHAKRQAVLRAERDAARAEAQARVSADPAMTLEQARALVDLCGAEAKSLNVMSERPWGANAVALNVFPRGSDEAWNGQAVCKDGRVTFTLRGNTMSRKAFIESLLNASARTSRA